MNLEGIIREVGELGVRNSRLNSDIKNWINRAQRTICERRNWTFMHDTIAATVAANATSVALPADFKELDSENSPVSYSVPGTNVPIPVTVMSRAEISRRGRSVPLIYAAIHHAQSPILEVYIEQNKEGIWTLNIANIAQQTQASDFTVSGYFYMAALEKGSDQNALTNHGDLVEALIARTKAIAYKSQDETDKRADACMADYDRHIRDAIYADASKKNGGRALHA